MGALEDLTRAVLFEGYLLWPYRRSALKNRSCWTLGGVYPEGWSLLHPDDPSRVAVECIVEGESPLILHARVRFLRLTDGQAHACEEDLVAPVLVLKGAEAAEVRVCFEEMPHWLGQEALSGLAAMRPESTPAPSDPAGASRAPTRVAESNKESAEITSAAGLKSHAQCLDGELRLTIAPTETNGGARVTAEVVNRGIGKPASRDEALLSSFLSLHLVLRVEQGQFVSSIDPPKRWKTEVSHATQAHLWPVLAGERDERDTMLAAPIILPDHPAVAPESDLDFFDSTEIDEMLLLNTLALADEERAQIGSGDPWAVRILERALALGPARLRQIHGTFRGVRRTDER